jgi:hypothetical protein
MTGPASAVSVALGDGIGVPVGTGGRVGVGDGDPVLVGMSNAVNVGEGMAVVMRGEGGRAVDDAVGLGEAVIGVSARGGVATAVGVGLPH